MRNTKDHKLTIGWLYPDLMSIYGDRGNIITLIKRCEWRGIDIKVKTISLHTSVNELKSCDLLFMGGAQDRQQKIVSEDLVKKAKTLFDMIEKGIPGLYICGAFQFLGKYYKEADGTIVDGLGILDLYTVNPGFSAKRLIGNVVAKAEKNWFRGSDELSYIVGFENHGGRTYLGENIQPMSKVVKGYGNNGEDGTEGAVYKNSFGSYFHGPILPKNPQFADYLIEKALEIKYEDTVEITPLDESLELQAVSVIAKRLGLEL